MKKAKLAISTPKKGKAKEPLTHLLYVEKQECYDAFRLHCKFNNGDRLTIKMTDLDKTEWYLFCKYNKSKQDRYQWLIELILSKITIINEDVFYNN